jgi:16S rRNA (cytidine1402-2'-O)-methyltransferase
MENSEDLGKLYLIPSLLGDVEPLEVLPLSVKKTLDTADHYIVENEKSARAFIKKVFPGKPQAELVFFILNKYTQPQDYINFLEPALRGETMGLISEAGAPGVADPGAEIVSLAHEKNVTVVPLAGPSSILMALMASGMNGQNFAFTGYLPIDAKERAKRIKWLEKQSRSLGQSQIFMETPYRNQKLFKELLKSCKPETRLCVAREISLKQEFIKTLTIKEWSTTSIDLEKKPTIFAIDAQNHAL